MRRSLLFVLSFIVGIGVYDRMVDGVVSSLGHAIVSLLVATAASLGVYYLGDWFLDGRKARAPG